MTWTEDLEKRIKRKNQVLFTKDSELLAQLSCLIAQQNHRTLILWSFDLADSTVRTMEERYPDDKRLRNALNLSRLWAKGVVKMSVVKPAILTAHAMAKELTLPEEIAFCHAVGQACSVVHTPRHALGFSIYELTGFVREIGYPDCINYLKYRVDFYAEKLQFWQKFEADFEGAWAEFLMR